MIEKDIGPMKSRRDPNKATTISSTIHLETFMVGSQKICKWYKYHDAQKSFRNKLNQDSKIFIVRKKLLTNGERENSLDNLDVVILIHFVGQHSKTHRSPIFARPSGGNQTDRGCLFMGVDVLYIYELDMDPSKPSFLSL